MVIYRGYFENMTNDKYIICLLCVVYERNGDVLYKLYIFAITIYLHDS